MPNTLTLPPRTIVYQRSLGADSFNASATAAAIMEDGSRTFAVQTLRALSNDQAHEVVRMLIKAGYIWPDNAQDLLHEAGKMPLKEGFMNSLTSSQKSSLTFYSILGTISMAVSVYHGYKRNQSIGWAIVWGIMGGIFPVITPTVAIAQGFGKPKTPTLQGLKGRQLSC